jgi:Domain of unknown function (DUF4190)
MTHNGTHTGPVDPFGGVAFTGPVVTPGAGMAPPPGPPQGQAKTLATLSVVFAFVFAPVGAVLGHLALAEIKLGRQQGRDRALIGLTLSYVFILFAVVALLLWAVTAHTGSSSTTVAPATTASPPLAALPPDVQTTVITPPPPARRTVNVDELKTGDCVEIQQTQPDPNDTESQLIKIFPVNCEARDGVFRVDTISSSTNPCTDEYLANRANTIFACISKFKG